MGSTSSGDSEKEESFDWDKYLKVRNAEETPEDFFYHVCKSEQNGIELGSVLEIEHEDESGYWFASVCSSKGILLCLRYFGVETAKHDFWLLVESPRIHHLNWGSENNKKLVSPYPKSSCLDPDIIKEKVQDCEHFISEPVLQMRGAPIYKIFKPGMFVEVQDKEYPYRVWISKILNNVGGRLFLKMQGTTSPEVQPFWLFYSNERVFPLGWAEQKGLPWRVMNLDVTIEGAIDSSLLLNVLKPKTPKQHKFKIGDMFEVINPYSLMLFYVGTIVKIYDNRYFKVEVNNESDVEKRITFVATKENPYLFNAGWASKHKFLLKPPSDWKTTDKFCWSKYASMKESELPCIDNAIRRRIDGIHIGMKLEAVDLIDGDRIRVATIKGFTDHWIFLAFDRTSWFQELLHVRSVYSDEIFPVGWCNKHKYILTVPKLSYTNSNDYDHCYYGSDIDFDFNESDTENVSKYTNYFKGEIPYHYQEKKNEDLANNLEDNSIKNMLAEYHVQDSNNVQSLKNENIVTELSAKVKAEPSDVDEELHDALFLEDEIDKDEENISTNKEDNLFLNSEESLHINKNENVFKNHIKTHCSDQICVYFNKNCYPGNHLSKRRVQRLPNKIGPGSVLTVLYEAISLFVNLDYFPWNALKKIKQIEYMLINESEGVEMKVTTEETRSFPKTSEQLFIPQTKKAADMYCASLCNLSGMCEYFMTTLDTQCLHGCRNKEHISPLTESKMESLPNSMKAIQKKSKFSVATISSCLEKCGAISEDIAKVAAKELDWSNQPLVERYKYYMTCIVNYEAHILGLERSFTQLEMAILTECATKKNFLRTMDEIDIYSNTKSKMYKIGEDNFPFYFAWKLSFENYYRKDPRFKKFKIDIGHFETIPIRSNPKYWSPEDVYKYLSFDPYCKDFGKTLVVMLVDGVAFMLLNEEQLIHRLQCSLNLAIRVMCHVAEAKFIFLRDHSDIQSI